MSSAKFLHFFPPPKLLEMPAAGVDISDRSVKFVLLKRAMTGLRLGPYGEEEIPSGTIESGLVKNSAELTKALISIRPHLSSKYVAVSLPEEKAYLVSIKVPAVARRDLRETIELSLEEHVPLPTSQVIFDYEIAKASIGKNELVVLVSVFPADVVESYAESFLAAGLIPVSFEIEAHALARALIPFGEGGSTMIVDFGRNRTGFVVVSDGAVWFSSTVSIGGDDIAKVIEEKLSLTYEMARSLKEKRGISRAAEDKELYFAITPILSVLRDEISKHYLYWNTHADDSGLARKKIEHILMAGGDANIPGLVDYLSAGMDVPVSIGNPWVNIVPSFEETVPEIPLNHAIRYATALGLALRRFV